MGRLLLREREAQWRAAWRPYDLISSPPVATTTEVVSKHESRSVTAYSQNKPDEGAAYRTLARATVYNSPDLAPLDRRRVVGASRQTSGGKHPFCTAASANRYMPALQAWRR